MFSLFAATWVIAAVIQLGVILNATDMIEVDLQEADGAHFLVEYDSRVKYSHQCGGLACQQRELTGFLVPCADSSQMVKQFDSHFYSGSKYNGHCHGGIDEEDAKFIDNQLASIGHDHFSVDREMLAQSVEAWIHLRVNCDIPCIPFCYNSDSSSRVVLIWQNSD